MIGEGKVQKITIEGIEAFQLVVQSCEVTCRAQLIKHPVEDGTGVFDNKVREPRVITIRAFVSAKDRGTIGTLDRMWKNRTYRFYKITTRAGTYENFCCEECSHSEDSEKLDALDYTIRFCEILKATGRATAASGDDADTQNFGLAGA